jgi:uncharacterized lipoprotein YddW (UPF0748 family)
MLLLGGAAVAQPVLIEEIIRQTPGGTVRGYLATVNLSDPSVEVVVTAPPAPGSTFEATLTRTDNWRAAVGARLAVNANFFSTLSATTADIVGLSISDGVVVSPARQFGLTPDPALVFEAGNSARVDLVAPGVYTGIIDAIAGVGPSNTDTDPGTMLVTDGVNTGSTARVTPLTREPRTCAGVSRDGKRLYLLVIDGRQAGWSVGVTLPEAADLLLQRGVWRAVNLDGGGSSSFVFLTESGSVASNRPSDGAHRAVANHLGIRINGGATTDRTTRPIRGAWLRPTDIATFETTCASLAAAGLQDIFLETLYWGRDTARNNLPNFPHRFAFDFLGQAIPIAAKYGVRVHAWCETGYLDFGTTPSAFLAANPGYVVKHRDPANTTTGDLANQRFVNLGNPGVRAALNEYFAALATNYPALEGIQADYHFFPLAGSNAAPWSFDTWGRNAYQLQYGVDPITEVNLAATSFPSRWLTFNRTNVTDALVGLRTAVDGVSSGPTFHAVCFAQWNSSIHTSKMIDLPNWAATRASETYIPMSYFTSTTTVPGSNPPRNQAIDNDLAAMLTSAPGRRIVVGLANLTNATRPSVTVQLNTIKGRGLEEFIWFDAPTFVANASMRTELRTWIDTRPVPQRGDVNLDEYVDARDLSLFDALFTGTPVPRDANNARYDLNNDNTINQADRDLLVYDFRRFHFGDDGVVDARDLTALRNAFTPGPAPNPAILNLWDLNGDGAVDYSDQLILHAALTVPLPPDLDVSRDGVVNLEDLIAQSRSPIDVNRDGTIDAADTAQLEAALRANEAEGMTGQQR